MRFFRLIFLLFIISIICSSFVLSALPKPKEICYYTPEYIKCGEWSECKNGRWERWCHDIRECVNDGDEFKVTGRCSENYQPREEVKTPEEIEDEKEQEIREMFMQEFDDVKEEEKDLDLISADLISGAGDDSEFYDVEIEGLEEELIFGDESGESSSNLRIIVAVLIVLLATVGIAYYFLRKKGFKGKKLGDFRKEIRL